MSAYITSSRRDLRKANNRVFELVFKKARRLQYSALGATFIRLDANWRFWYRLPRVVAFQRGAELRLVRILKTNRNHEETNDGIGAITRVFGERACFLRSVSSSTFNRSNSEFGTKDP